MKRAALGIAFSAILLFLSSCDMASGETRPSSSGQKASQPVAVVELFTSEGCSSCPPADALLARLVADARQSGKRVFPLAFHVDYWNQIGWTDPFSSAAFSERQREYAEAFKIDSIYTPQMIVNGNEQFVGSDRSKAEAAIGRALKTDVSVAIELHVGLKNPGVLSVNCKMNTIPKGAKLNVALVERELVSKVTAGENGGHQLKHENVVRTFVVRPVADATAVVEIVVPESAKLKNSSVVAYVQDATSMAILGASSVDTDDLAASSK